ncbi:NAD-dependent epimerase/dehydratase family protein [Candidatus Poribacteria bacterium]
MKVLIIGGTGLISTVVTRLLIEREHEVLIYNRGIRESKIPDKTVRILGDRRNREQFEMKMAEAGDFDCVIDMICFTPEDAESAVRAFRGRTEQYILCSTVAVYTKSVKHYPVTEDTERNPSPSFVYGYNKARCENIILKAHDQGDFPVTIIRPSHTYGESGTILHTLGWGTDYLDRLRKGKPIVVHGDGSSLWSPCYKADMGRAFVGAVGNPKALGKSYHVTAEEWMTWNCYHREVAEAMGAPPPRLVHIPTDLLEKIAPEQANLCIEDLRFNNIFDNISARTDLGFRSTVPWVEGVRRTVAWLDKRGQIENSDDGTFYDQIIAAWERLVANMTHDLMSQE